MKQYSVEKKVCPINKFNFLNFFLIEFFLKSYEK